MNDLAARAPTGMDVVEYDRRHLALYAELISADDLGRAWTCVAEEAMGLDVGSPEAKACWMSHLERARWLIGEGLNAAIVAFGRP